MNRTATGSQVTRSWRGYRLHPNGGDWKVYDVAIDGVSLVTSNRSSFAAEIQQGGIDALTSRLAQRNRENGG